MAKQHVTPGSGVHKRIKIFVQDTRQPNIVGLTGLAFNTANFVWYYIKDGDAAVTTVTPATATVGTWTDSGFKEVDSAKMPGWYELGIPAAALAGGDLAMRLGGAANMGEVNVEIQTSDSPIDITRTNQIETGVTLQGALRLLGSTLGGKLSGGGTSLNTIRDVNDTKNRVVAVVDSSGNRSAVTLDLS